jgi:2,3-bisphosphoglycerate-dependent phosphoglycerate mutase
MIRNRFLIARHGESIWNKDSKFTGWTNIPLTNTGREEAAKMALELYRRNVIPNLIFSSVLERSIETATIIQKQLYVVQHVNIPIYTSWRLNERHYGTLEGIPRQYIRDKFGNVFTHLIRCDYNMKPPIVRGYKVTQNAEEPKYPIYRNCYFHTIKHGESKENVLDRVLPYYENDILYTVSEGKLPLIITHKHTARVLMKNILCITDEDFEKYEFPNKAILDVELDDDSKYKSHREIDYS